MNAPAIHFPPTPVCKFGNCTRSPHESSQDFCIFHDKDKDPQEFRDALAAQIREWRRTKAKEWNFTGFIFIDRDRKPNLFHRWRFPCVINFTQTIFACSVNFYSARFTHSTSFFKTVFRKDAGFHGVQFNDTVDFSNARFGGHADFNWVTFSSHAYFNTALFANDALFASTDFSQNANFIGAKMKRADFYHVKFEGEANFGGTRFRNNVSFERGRFLNDANFQNVRFGKDATFRDSQFGADMTMRGSKIHGCLTLRKIWLLGTERIHVLHFTALTFGRSGLLDMRDNDLWNVSSVVVRECNVGRMLFSHTDTREVHFENVSFEILGARSIIGDEWVRRNVCEMKDDEKPSWRSVEITYERFTKVFRDCYDHPAANECERGYFEARRNTAREQAMAAREFRKYGKKKWLRRWGRGRSDALLITVYKCLSHYSGNLVLPLLWLMLFTLLVWPTAYCLFMPSSESFATSLRVASLSRDAINLNDFVSWDRFWISFIVAFQLIITAAFVTLFVLALRRRFKHSD